MLSIETARKRMQTHSLACPFSSFLGEERGDLDEEPDLSRGLGDTGSSTGGGLACLGAGGLMPASLSSASWFGDKP